MRYMGTEKTVCCKCGVELDVPVYENGGNKKYGYKHCHQCGASLLSADEKEVLLSTRTGIAAKYGYTQEQVSAYWQGVEDARYKLEIMVKKEILRHLDSMMICIGNAYDTSHWLLESDIKFIEQQEKCIKELLSDIPKEDKSV